MLRTQNKQNSLKRKNRVGGIKVPNFKNYYYYYIQLLNNTDHSLANSINRKDTDLPTRPYLRKKDNLTSIAVMSFDAPPGSPFGAVASDPHAPLLNASCLDLLLIELVPMAERLAKELSTTDDKQADEEEIRETTFFRLESLGYRVGQGLAER